MKSEVFSRELELIADPQIRNWTMSTLENAPDNFFTAPASTTGKYHPPCTLGIGGLVVHTKRVVWIANRLCGGMDISGLRKDIVISACILHDIAKTGKGTGEYKDYLEHPINASKYFVPSLSQTCPDIYMEISDCVKHHMSLWSPPSIKKPINNYLMTELCVANSDYLATTKTLVTPVDGSNEPLPFLSGELPIHMKGA